MQRMLSIFSKSFKPNFPDEIVGVIGDIHMGKARKGLSEVLIHNKQDWTLLTIGQWFSFFSSKFTRAKLFNGTTIVDIEVNVAHLLEGRSDALIPRFSSLTKVELSPEISEYLREYYMGTVVPKLSQTAQKAAAAYTPKKEKSTVVRLRKKK